jgi:branched-chain amino acid transport system ATP-binding protein
MTRSGEPSADWMLEATDLVAGYGETTVLRGVTLRIPRGGVVALLGPNGAGKTTLLRAISGLIKPANGTVLLDGNDVTGRSADYMSRAGLCHLPEGRGIFPSLTVRENLVLMSPRGRETPSIEQAVESFPVLGARLSQLAGSLSGGEQQMLALVRSFVTNPKVVAVDEASLGLAPLVVEQIFFALQQIVEGGAALLLVEQYVTRALQLADTAYVLNRGQVTYSGSADELGDGDVFQRYLGATGAVLLCWLIVTFST